MSPPLIAVLDPDPTICHLLADLLTDAGYRVWTGPRTPATAAHLGQQPPTLLILDLPAARSAPVWTLLDTLRATPATARLPILVYSAAKPALRAATPRLSALGCAVLDKPFDLDELLTTIAALLDASPPACG